MSADDSAGAAAAAAAAVLGFGVLQAFPLEESLNDAPVPCQMQLCLVAGREPTRMRWTNHQVRTTVL